MPIWLKIEKLVRHFVNFLPWQVKYLLGKAGVGGVDISIDRHFEYAFVVKRLMDKNRGVLVDIGGAGSLLSPMLAAMGNKVIGYDLYQWSLAYPGYQHQVGDACAMKFDDASIDICVSISCIEHLGDPRYGAEEQASDKALMKEVLRVLKPGGIFIITVPYGVRHTHPAQHVYDEEEIKTLSQGFNEVSREIYVPRDDEGFYHYRLGTEQEAIIKRPWFRYSVIALELQKPVK